MKRDLSKLIMPASTGWIAQAGLHNTANVTTCIVCIIDVVADDNNIIMLEAFRG